MRDLVKTDVWVGLLAYADGEPVGWCSVAPRSTFPALAGVGSPDEPVWSITCFYLKAEYRRKGLQRMLLEAAMREATMAGAKAMEAYPVEPDSPSYRFGGFIPFFVRAGFREVGRLGSRRHVMRKKLSGSGRPGRNK
jgi:GNAT superfamily N-acetyltransferase